MGSKDIITFVIVDDATFIRQVLRKIIEENTSYSVVGEADDGIKAIDQARIHKPDVMTVDITMPNMDGIQAIQEIKKICPLTKIIVVSAMSQQAMIIDAVKAGADDFIVKPFDKNRVQQSIENLL